jgi:hypothetical protein
MLPSNSSATPVAHSTNAGPDQYPHRRLAVVLIVGGLIGLVAAVVLLVEKIALIENPGSPDSPPPRPWVLRSWRGEHFSAGCGPASK